MQAPQFTSPPPGQKTLAGFLQGGSARDSRPFRGAAEPPDAGGASVGTEGGGAPAGQPEALCEGFSPGSGQGPGGTEEAGGAARAASAYFAVATAPGGRARLPGAYGEAGRRASPLDAQSSGSDGLAEASISAGASSGPAANSVEEPGEGSGSQALMPSLRDWAVPSGAPDDAGGSGGGAAQEGGSLAPSGGAGDAEEGGWPAGYFPAEAEAGWADAGAAEDDDAEEDMADGAAGLAEPGDAGGPTLAPRIAASFGRVGGVEEDEASDVRGSAPAQAAERAGPLGDARGSAGGALRDRGPLARWQCLVCTFAGNRAEVLRCALCDTLKNSRAWQPPRAPQAATLPEALPGSLAATLDLLGRASAQAPGSGDAERCGGAAAAEGPAGFLGAGGGASEAPASGAAAGAAPAAAEAEGAEPPLGSAAGAAPPHADTAAQGADAAAGSHAAEPDWEPVDGSACSGWRCRRCGEVVGGGAGSGEGSGPGTGSAGAQARGAHNDWHFALEMQRRESGPGHEPGPRGLGPGASGAGKRCGGGADRAVEAGSRSAGGRKRKAGGNANSARERSRLSRGTMDAFLLRANAKGS